MQCQHTDYYYCIVSGHPNVYLLPIGVTVLVHKQEILLLLTFGDAQL